MAATPRATERLLAAAALLFLSPALGLSAAAIRFTSRGPILYRATRIGLAGRPFKMYKLRTMHWDGEQSGGLITAGSDRRVFPVGRVLRKTKLDESLQLVNVILGNMALVGPRPEDPQIVEHYYSPTMKETLDVLPGLTSPGTLYYLLHGERSIPEGLGGERYYAEHVLPRKLAIDVAYVRRQSLSYDITVLVQTLLALVGHRGGFPRQRGKSDEARSIEAEIRRERRSNFSGGAPVEEGIAVDLEGMSMVRELTPDDAPAVAALHAEAFERFFLTSLGERFLRQFYRSFLAHPSGFGIAIIGSNGCIAFAVGSLHPGSFYRELARSNGLTLLRAALPVFARHPGRLVRVVRSVSQSSYRIQRGDAVLYSICVAPATQGRGFGTTMLGIFERRARAEGCRAVALTTDGDDNELAQRFYRKNGYQVVGGTRSPHGRLLHCYRKAIAPSDAPRGRAPARATGTAL